MPPLRLLPPRFLLPAWTAPQVQYVQRAHSSGSTNELRMKQQTEQKQPTDATSKPQSPSLFEELFPEESKVETKKSEKRNVRDSGFPSIEDVEKVSQIFPRKDSWREALNISASGTSWTESLLPKNLPQGLNNPNPVFRQNLQDKRIRREASVLVLSNAAPSLSESDFLRIGPRGKHIKSWTSGLVKVIPARDPQTLEPLGYYFLIFSTDAAARAYRQQLVRFHRILRTHNDNSITPSLLPPPGFLKAGEDIHTILQAYTIIPASQALITCRILQQPLSATVRRLLKGGGYPEIATSDTVFENKVLFSLDKGFPTAQAIRLLLSKDQKARNLHWKLAESHNDILKLGKSNVQSSVNAEGEDVLDDYHHATNRRTQHTRWILTFQDSQEARRFVRSWHQRAIEDLEYHSPDGEPSPRASAELLW